MIHLDGILNQLKREFAILKWSFRGRPIPPPPALKQKVVKQYAQHFDINILIETGTFNGDMIYTSLDLFSRIYSIEIDELLYRQASQRFANYPQVHLYWGDSSKKLPEILSIITEPCLFWLDAHYSGGETGKGELITPVMQEFGHILGHPVKEHVILIDDARDFIGEEDYPTISEIQESIIINNPTYNLYIKDDIIRIHRGRYKSLME